MRFWQENRMVLTAVLVLLITFLPVGLVHEAGHIMVCTWSGFDYVITPDAKGIRLDCGGIPDNTLVYFAMGGILGTAASIALLIPRRLWDNLGIRIGLQTMAFTQFIQFVFETWYHASYVNSEAMTVLLGLASVLFMVSLIRFYSPRKRDV